jgi:WD40 repeat protein
MLLSDLLPSSQDTHAVGDLVASYRDGDEKFIRLRPNTQVFLKAEYPELAPLFEELPAYSSGARMLPRYLSNLARRLTWSPNGRYLAVWSSGSTFLLFDWDTGVPVQVGTTRTGSNLAWSSDSRYLASVDGTSLRAFDFNDSPPSEISATITGTTPSEIAFKPGSYALAIVNTSTLVYEIVGGSFVLRQSAIDASASCVKWLTDGSNRFIIGRTNITEALRLYSGADLTNFASVGTVESAPASAYNIRAVATHGDLVFVARDTFAPFIQPYRLAGNTLTPLPYLPGSLFTPLTIYSTMAVSPDGRYLTVLTDDTGQKIHVWDLESWTKLPQLQNEYTLTPACVTWGQDGRYLTIGYNAAAQSVVIYDLYEYDPATEFRLPASDMPLLIRAET